ncbi:MAG: dienelactone hydrolase family protein [Candidatus Lindowbacteria bacterium]|nr:dienelactone hydrolase family protein [Candidatus Lindowbacteria bacterium]
MLAVTMNAEAKVQTQAVEYTHEGTALGGYVAYDDAVAGIRPGVVVIHEWTGIDSYVQKRTEQLAALGYVAFAVDMYGKGIRPKTREEAAAQASIYKADRKLMRARAKEGLEALRKYALTDPKRIAVIGYCFGGGVALELARSGADIAGVVSFHGNLDTPTPGDAKNIKAKVLVLHGADDPHVPAAQVAAFQKEMGDGNVDWQMVAYGGAVHSFTNPEAGNDPASGVAYNEKADKRSWETMKEFFAEIFRQE